MTSSKTQRAAARSDGTEEPSIACSTRVTCSSSTERKADLYALSIAPRVCTMFCTSPSSRSASSWSCSSSSSSSSSSGSFFLSSRLSIDSLSSSIITAATSRCCSAEKCACGHVSQASMISEKCITSVSSVSVSGSTLSCASTCVSMKSLRPATSSAVAPCMPAPMPRMQELRSSGIAPMDAVRTSSMYWNLTRGTSTRATSCTYGRKPSLRSHAYD
mmetsp:Transcript_973/g.1561  ORF Transcript_973/g.1561 Transcript_973/m.1561 type:complete len:217 (+) Transcript_973:52-702(+)